MIVDRDGNPVKEGDVFVFTIDSQRINFYSQRALFRVFLSNNIKQGATYCCVYNDNFPRSSSPGHTFGIAGQDSLSPYEILVMPKAIVDLGFKASICSLKLSGYTLSHNLDSLFPYDLD